MNSKNYEQQARTIRQILRCYYPDTLIESAFKKVGINPDERVARLLASFYSHWCYLLKDGRTLWIAENAGRNHDEVQIHIEDDAHKIVDLDFLPE